MRQIVQNLKTGEIFFERCPVPKLKSGSLMIRTRKSLVSLGTEKSLLEFGKSSLIGKAKAQPEKVKMVLDKIRAEGLYSTYETVKKRLDEPLSLGYCNVGTIHKVNDKDRSRLDIHTGDRVVSNGPHAEIVSVSKNLCAKIPDNVDDEEAVFTVIGAIGLQGLRLANPTLGEKFVVFGAGLIGLIVVQLLRASGCDVLAIDLDEKRLEVAQSFDSLVCNPLDRDPISAAKNWTKEAGVDGVIITASAKNDQIVHQAAAMCRKRGRIILTGSVGLQLNRADFYEKELTFQVSCSYGPGRYDDNYEVNGHDYPLGFVRWTEQRNFDAILSMMASARLNVLPLISHRIPFEEAITAYDQILTDSSALGVILQYPTEIEEARTVEIKESPLISFEGRCVAAVIGDGNYAKMTLCPALSKTSARLKYIASQTNIAGASYIGRKYGFENITTDLDQIFKDSEVNTVFIATAHNSHSKLCQDALSAGKHVFVEKPLCLDVNELNKIIELYRSNYKSSGKNRDNINVHSVNGSPVIENRESFQPLLMVGFNRRFSPHAIRIHELLTDRNEPISMAYTFNAGMIPSDSWVQNPEIGGGRIIGEACHCIDLLSFISGSRVASIASAQMGKGPVINEDKMSIVLSFEDGSIGSINYFANGARNYPKETLDIFSEGRILALNNFRTLRGYGFKRFKKFKTRKVDKGHQAEFKAFVDLINKGSTSLLTINEIVNVTLSSFAALTSAREIRTIRIAQEYAKLLHAYKDDIKSD